MFIPHRTALVVGVRGADGAEDSVSGRVLFDLHDVTGSFEHRGLVHVLHDDLNGGFVGVAPHREETRVPVDVFHLDSQTVLTLLLEVQRLQENTKWN